MGEGKEGSRGLRPRILHQLLLLLCLIMLRLDWVAHELCLQSLLHCLSEIFDPSFLSPTRLIEEYVPRMASLISSEDLFFVE